MKKKLLILGWDAADWEVINSLLERNLMPALQKVLNEGVRGKLATMDPPISPMLWTSIATGVPPQEHGIIGFVEPAPDGEGLRALNSTSRKVKAFWNILNQNNLKCNVVGWWPSHPAEPINGVMVSNFYQMVTGNSAADWKMQDGTVYPNDLKNELEQLRIHPTELTMTHIIPFIPELFAIDHEKEKIPAQLRKELAQASSIHAASTWLMQHTEWDVMAVYYDFIDHCSHMGMRYREPQQKGIDDKLFNYYKNIVDGAYRFQDMMLDRMLDLIDEDTSIMILSDHGFESGKMRPRLIPNEPAGPTHEHSQYGIFVWSGPSIKKNQAVYGSTLLDITPSILSYFDIPIGKDMKGNVILSAFESVPIINTIESWQNNNEGYSGEHSESDKIDAWSSKEALDQLIELGYVEKPSSDSQKAIQACKNETDYYLARSYLFSEDFEPANHLLEKLVKENEGVFRYESLYCHSLLHLHKYELLEEQANKHLNRKESWIKSFALFVLGKAAFAQYKGYKAKSYFLEAQQLSPNSTDINFQLASNYLAMGKYAEAIEQFDRVLLMDERHVFSLFGKARVFLLINKLEESIDLLLEVIEYRFMFPPAHYYLGKALLNAGDVELAIQAFETCMNIAPKMIKPLFELKKIYGSILPNHSKLADLEQKIKSISQFPISVICGLPGSGAEIVAEDLSSSFASLRVIKSQNEDDRVLKVEDDINDSNVLYYMDISKLISLPHGKIVRLVLVTRKEDALLKAQLEISGRNKLLKEKVFPSKLNELNNKQNHLLNNWLKQRPEVEVMVQEFEEYLDNKAESSNAILYLLKDNVF